MSISELKIHIKTWEHQFIEKHDRAPTKDDIKSLPDIKQLYKKYSSLKKRSSDTTGHKSKSYNYSKKESIEKSHLETNDLGIGEGIQIRNTFVSPIKAVKKDSEEFGPTPQIYGKAISIFDMKISPIKQEVPLVNIELQTPEKTSPASTISANSSISTNNYNTTESQVSVKRQLQFNVTPISSPIKKPVLSDFDVSDMVGAGEIKLGKPNLVVPSVQKSRYGPNSPLKLEEQNIRIKLRNTPLRKNNTYNNQQSYSPSPLIKKPLTKSLLELAREHEAIVEEFMQLNEQIKMEESSIVENEVNDSDNGTNDDELISNKEIRDIFNEESTEIHRAKTIKVKRRRVIRRFENDSTTKTAIPLNLHKELLKLKKEQVKEYMNISESDEEDEHSEADENDDAQTKNIEKKIAPKKKRPKKYNLVSNNFRRLKLPHRNGFKNRWGNRRR